MQVLLTLALKDLRLLWRDKFGLFWVIVFPLLMALFFGSIFGSGGGGARNMKIAVVDLQQTETSRDLIEQLKTRSILAIDEMPLDSAREKVRKGSRTAYVLIGESAEGNGNPFAMPPMELGVDPARRAEASYLQGMVMETWFGIVKRRMTDRAEARKWIDNGLASLKTDTSLNSDQRQVLQNLLGSFDDYIGMMEEADSTGDAAGGTPFGDANIDVVEITSDRNMPRSAFEITFPQALNWALLGCTLTFALSIVTERQRGTYHRLRIAPLTRAHILAGKGLACFIAATSVCTVLLLVGMTVFDVRIANPPGIVLALLGSSLCFVGLMMLISVLGKTEQSVGGAGWAIMLVMTMVGGGMVPLVAMPSWMLAMSNFSIVKWAIYAFEGAVWRGLTMTQLMLPVAILVTVGIVAYIIGVSILTRFDR